MFFQRVQLSFFALLEVMDAEFKLASSDTADFVFRIETISLGLASFRLNANIAHCNNKDQYITVIQ